MTSHVSFQINGTSTRCLTAYSSGHQRSKISKLRNNHCPFVRGLQRGPMDSPHKESVLWNSFHVITSSFLTDVHEVYHHANHCQKKKKKHGSAHETLFVTWHMSLLSFAASSPRVRFLKLPLHFIVTEKNNTTRPRYDIVNVSKIIHNITSWACAWNAGNVFLAINFK